MTNYPALPIKYDSRPSEVHGRCDATDGAFITIDSTTTYEQFFEKFLLSNRPCIFLNFLTESWNCRKEWVTSSGQPNYKFLQQSFGHITVPVADCGQEENSAHPKEEMKFTDYIDYIVNYKNSSHPNRDRCLYLKDWHFRRDCPDNKAYETPVYFKSDWLNEYWDVIGDTDHDDYRFVYIGPKGSWTPFHADVFRSYSWSANICGRKKWIFYAPGEEDKLKDKFGNLIYDVTQPIDHNRYNQASQIQSKYEIIQEAGEVIFVPSGWHHQVINLEDTISINHNWLNGCCVENCWNFIKFSLLEVEKEISDCRDMENWHQHCQMILKASSGIDFTEFYMFMSTIARHRMDELFKLSSNYVCSVNDSKQNSLFDAKLDLFDRYTLKKPIDMENCSLSVIKKADRLLIESKNTEKCDHIEKESEATEVLEKCDICDSESSQLTMYDTKYHWRYINAQHALFDLNKVKDIVHDMLEQSVFTILDQTSLDNDHHTSTDTKFSKDKSCFISKAKQLLCDIDSIIKKFS